MGAYRLDRGDVGDDTHGSRVSCKGEAAAVDEIARWFHSGPAFARVDDVDTTRAEIAGLSMIEVLS